MIQKIFLTLFFVGLSKKAPGTIGSFVALVIAIALIYFFSASTIFLLSILIGLIAIKQIDSYEKKYNTHDEKSIVIDELVGMFLAFAMTFPTQQQWFWEAITSFIWFRYFDIVKPSIIAKVDKRVKGGLGVVGDDVLAGFFGGIAAHMTLTILRNFF